MLLPVFDDEEVGRLLGLGRAQCCFLCLMTRRWTGCWRCFVVTNLTLGV